MSYNVSFLEIKSYTFDIFQCMYNQFKMSQQLLHLYYSYSMRVTLSLPIIFGAMNEEGLHILSITLLLYIHRAASTMPNHHSAKTSKGLSQFWKVSAISLAPQ